MTSTSVSEVSVLLTEDLGPVRILRMNRPDKRNALNTSLTQSLVDGLKAAAEEGSVRAVVLAAEGDAFCAGADISEFADFRPDQPEQVERRAALTSELHGLFPRIAKPIVAAVQGAGMGGGAGLALACDLVVMARDAKLGYPEVQRGIVPAIVMANLVRQLGRKMAFELVGLGLPVTADIASRWGIVNRVVDRTEVISTAVDLANRMAAYSVDAVATTKALLARVSDLGFEEGLEEGRLANIRMRGFQR